MVVFSRGVYEETSDCFGAQRVGNDVECEEALPSSVADKIKFAGGHVPWSIQMRILVFYAPILLSSFAQACNFHACLLDFSS